ncbi:hypothetical protein G7Y89_g9682 [Cudoniella acicularis]|uniref:CFEM domain-containing protein n=1 Tax=Cudoniella acicularis TaxID=354080 RepID=A0A8H4W2C5_9HELO|nr:hypothetical protein G7Y89_g9682 [Cudoniella acicularis]
MAGNGTSEGLSGVLSALPSCAENCTIAAASYLAICDSTTTVQLAACLCTDEKELQKITECVQDSCSYPDWEEVIHSAHTSLCRNYPIPDRTEWFRKIAIALLALTIPFILLRIYSRMVVTRKYGWDDYTFIIASLFYASQLDYVFVQILSKVSILLFFLQIFLTQKWIRLGSYLTLTFLGFKGVIFLFIVIFQCTPIVSTWDRSVPGHCVNTKVLTYLAGGLSIIEDFVTLSLPIPCISALNIGKGKKATTIMMFTIGSLACILSIVRFRFLIGFGAHVDTTWENVDAFAWSVIENSFALICACLPALRPIISIMLPRVFGAFWWGSAEAMPPKQKPVSLSVSWRHKGHTHLQEVAAPRRCQKWRKDLERDTTEGTQDSGFETHSDEYDGSDLVVVNTENTKGAPRLDFSFKIETK